MGARETALSALIACRKDGAWANSVLKEYILRDRLDSRDSALATRLVYGVIQNRGLLDFYLRQLLTGKLRDLQPVVRDILHMGLYQLYQMDKIPESAAVNESVQLAKKYSKNPKVPALVNGILRNAQRSRAELKQPVSYADRYSHPEELISLLKASLPKGKLEPMLIANNAAPQTVIQVNTMKITTQALQKQLEGEGIGAQPHSWMKDCLVLDRTGNLEQLKSFREGLFYVQDPASKLSVLCAKLEKGWCVLDCCAAPGGKSFAAAMEMEDSGKILSCDLYGHKIPLIQKGAQRLGIQNHSAKQQDASVFVPQWESTMDAVIVDAPCSGFGIIRKKPDIRYKNLKEMEQLPQLQLQILKNQARYVRPGGVLMYSTCTVLTRENEDVVTAFLAEHPQFSLEALPLPEIFPENTTGMLTLIPGEYDTDGFFICRMRRSEEK